MTPQPLMSLPRFLLVLFPLFMWLGLVGARGGARRGPRGPRAERVGLAAFTAQFATWHLVA